MMATQTSKTDKSVKKGDDSWAEPKLLQVANKNPDFAYRWVRKDEHSVERRLGQGWSIVNKTSGIPGNPTDPDLVATSNSLDGARSINELVLMAIPADRAKARRAHLDERTREQTTALKRGLRKDLNSVGAPTTGEIRIRSNEIVIDE
jgi:hypothetical protein